MKIIAFLILCTAAMSTVAQPNSLTSSGNASVGTGTPLSQFHIKHNGVFFNPSAVIFENSSGTSVYSFINSSNNFFLAYNSNSSGSYPQADYSTRFYITSGGNVGIGTTTPYNRLHVEGSIGASADVSAPTYFEFKRPSDGWIASRVGNVHGTSWQSHLVFETNAGSSYTDIVERMRITYNGNVLIGKTSQTNSSYKLDVNGSARLNEVVINTNGADFVFEKEYKLPALADVERFIRQYKHLPDVSPASEMQANGVAVGDITTKLLQKVEELTLYVIDLNKKTDELAIENEKLRAQLNSLRKSAR